MLLDLWQQEFLNTKGNKILVCGRQVGKSIIASDDAKEYATANKNKTILMIAPTERQAYALFEKTMSSLLRTHPKMISKGKDKPTQTHLKLTNGTKIWCLPVGISGLGIRFLTIDRLYVDEAAKIPEEVWTAVTPMLLTTGGDTIIMTTPFGKQGRAYEIWINKNEAYPDYTHFSITSRKCLSEREVCDTWTQEQRTKALAYLDSEEKRMGKVQYAQEYIGEFMDELRAFFSTDLIKSCMTLPKPSAGSPLLLRREGDNYLGVDVARMGDDDTVLFPLKRVNREELEQLEDVEITRKTLLTETIQRIKRSDARNGYRKIYIDDAGLGAGVFDVLLDDEQTRRKIVGINNASRSIDKDDRHKKLLKEDLYNNLLMLMQQGRIRLYEDNETAASLSSVQVEYKGDQMVLDGNYTHITEALIRAAWCMKDKSLNLWIR